jgi:hypothetical protein
MKFRATKMRDAYLEYLNRRADHEFGNAQTIDNWASKKWGRAWEKLMQKNGYR